MSVEKRADQPGDTPWPPRFETWPRRSQIEAVAKRYKRSAIACELLRWAGLDVDERDVGGADWLTIHQLAAIYLAKERRGGFDDERWPVGFEAWDFDQQLDHLKRRFTREGLREELLFWAGVDTIPTLSVDSNRKLTTELLAAMYLAAKGIGHV